MTTPIEKVARALAGAKPSPASGTLEEMLASTWLREDAPAVVQWIAEVATRAAIEALLEPSPAMLAAVNPGWPYPDPTPVWQAMLRAALNTHQPDSERSG